MTVTITDEEYQELRSTIFILRRFHILERDKILDTWRYWLPRYKQKLNRIDTKIDLINRIEELLK